MAQADKDGLRNVCVRGGLGRSGVRGDSRRCADPVARAEEEEPGRPTWVDGTMFERQRREIKAEEAATIVYVREVEVHICLVRDPTAIVQAPQLSEAVGKKTELRMPQAPPC